MNTDDHLNADEVEAVCQPTGASSRQPAPERLAISDHLAGCAVCRGLVAAARTPSSGQRRRLAADMQALAAARHEWTREEEDLQTFARFLTTFPAERFEPGSTLLTQAKTRAATPSADGYVRTVMLGSRWWAGLFSSPFLLTAGVAVLAVAAVLVTLMISERPSVGGSASTRPIPILQDGSVVVAADGRLHTDSNLPAELRQAIVAAVAQRSLHLPARTVGTLRGETGAPTTTTGEPSASTAPLPLLPTSGTIVENDRPLLQWTGVPGSTAYQVEITLLTTGETLLSPRLPISQTSWQPGSPLERGRIYHWRVLVNTPPELLSGLGGAGPSTSTFKVLGSADEEELRKIRMTPGASHLALAVTYARLGLLGEAKAELKTLHAANPHSTLALDLSNSLR